MTKNKTIIHKWLVGTLTLAGCLLGSAASSQALAASTPAKAPAHSRTVRPSATSSDPAVHAWAKARSARWRAKQAASAGDTTHARALEKLAKEWEALAKDIGRTVALEHAATSAQQQAADVRTKLRRARARLEQLAAQKSRTKAKLSKLQTNSHAPISPAAVSAGLRHRKRPATKHVHPAPAHPKGK